MWWLVYLTTRSLIFSHYEQPGRITKIDERFTEYDLKNRMSKLSARKAKIDELCLVHTQSHVNWIKRNCNAKADLRLLAEKYDSIYFHEKTFNSARVAAGSVLEVTFNIGIEVSVVM